MLKNQPEFGLKVQLKKMYRWSWVKIWNDIFYPNLGSNNPALFRVCILHFIYMSKLKLQQD